VSLVPPLVLFCPSRLSATWPRIARAGHFCANVLAADQRGLARAFGTSAAAGTRGADKFAGVSWSPSPAGAPVLDGALTWGGAGAERVHGAGDPWVAMGGVPAGGGGAPAGPRFSPGGRSGGPPARRGAGPPGVAAPLLPGPRHADWM